MALGASRINEENRRANQALVDLVEDFARQKNAAPAQIALAWILAQKPWIVPIPGTTKVHLPEENLGGAAVELTVDDLGRLKVATIRITESVMGPRMDSGDAPQSIANLTAQQLAFRCPDTS